MSKRHWLRDVIDFTGETCLSSQGCFEHHPDDCDDCNASAKEIADSLALYGVSLDSADRIIQFDYLYWAARVECGAF